MAACTISVGVLALSAVGAVIWRSAARSSERQAFTSASANVTATLGTLLRRDVDFVSTIRALLIMQPHLTPSTFSAWYGTFQGADRQFGGLGGAVVESVPAERLRAFQARRNADRAFRAVVGNPITLAPGASTGHCLVSAAVSVVPSCR